MTLVGTKPLLVALVGPTASRKTDVSLALAERLSLVVLSADSRQVFKGMDIGTAKPTVEQRQRVRHEFIDILRPDEPYSAGAFERDGLAALPSILSSGHLPLVVGGSGLYVNALVYGLSRVMASDSDIRARLESQMEEDGEDAMMRLLESVDPSTALQMERGKPRRIIRALEVYYTTGKPVSAHRAEPPPTRPFTARIFGLEVPRSELYSRIDERVLRMLEAGLIDEVRRLKSEGYDDRFNALNTVGYKEVAARIRGEIDEKEMIRLIQRNTRRYAKRQMTWFRASKEIEWIDASNNVELESIADRLVMAINQARS